MQMRLWAVLGLWLAAAAGQSAATRPEIRSAADVPAAVFHLSEPPSRAFLSDDFVTQTLPALKLQAESVRAEYSIADPSVADTLRRGLAAIALLQGRPQDAQALVIEARRAATKPQLRAITLLRYEALAAANTGSCEAGAALIRQRLEASDPAVIRDEALAQREAIETVSASFFSGILASQMDAAAATRGGVTLLEGMQLASDRVAGLLSERCRMAFSSAIAVWASDPKSTPLNIWPAREPHASMFQHARPVVVAVWDHGFDTTLFPDQLAHKTVKPTHAKHRDGSTPLDDWNGPTFDNRLKAMPSPLPPASRRLAPQLSLQMTLQKGDKDLIAGDETVEGRIYAQHAREAPPAVQAEDALLWEEVSYRGHGTEVASEIADGAPFVRLYNVAALPFGREPEPVALDEAQIDRWIRAIGVAAVRMRGAHVRVVNLSWGLAAQEIADNLLDVGGETDPARATKRAAALFRRADAALRAAIASCPDILFVVGAGNSNQAEDILADTPQTIFAPNVIVVGASGLNGRATSFTTYGPHVVIYAQGQTVRVRTPGGMVSTAFGTSMAAPLVARAAAEMLAVNARLSPEQLIEGLTSTATPGGGGLRLVHPAASVEWARSH